MTDRTRLQVFIPTATAQALDQVAEGLGLSRAQTVERILGQYLAHQGILTDATWPKPKSAASVQRPITMPTRLAGWLRRQPGTMSDATRSAIAKGINIERKGSTMYLTPDAWKKQQHRVNVRIPATMAAVICARQEQHQLSWSEVASTYILHAYAEASQKG